MDLTIGKYTVSVTNSTTIRELKEKYAKASKKSIHRLSFKLRDIRMDDDSKTLEHYGFNKDSTVTVIN
jgi:hypothetical protein